MSVPAAHLHTLAALLFGLGVLGFLVRRNVIIVLASLELMLNATNLSLLAASRHWSQPALAGQGDPRQGPILFLFVILVAAAEAAVGLALVIALYRLKRTIALDAAGELKG